jgi:hypothetical protein
VVEVELILENLVFAEFVLGGWLTKGNFLGLLKLVGRIEI